jgi:hypothetical protein
MRLPWNRHCEPFDAACGGAQGKPLLRSGEAIQSMLSSGAKAGLPRRSAPRNDEVRASLAKISAQVERVEAACRTRRLL